MGLLARIARALVRIAGWLVTPIAATVAAALGATITAMVAPTLSPMTGLGVAAGGGLVGAIVGLALWVRLLRGSPQLQEALAMTADGAPRPDAVDELLAGDPPAAPPGAP